MLSRRRFVRLTAGAAAAAAGGGFPFITSCGDPSGPADRVRSPLLRPAEIGAGRTLLAAPGVAPIAEGESAAAWLFNGSLPSPTIRTRRGDVLAFDLGNDLPDPTIIHWHGLLVPPEADGHPRSAIAAGATYRYEFPVIQRAGTYWYHPHAHHRTGEQIHRGLAGFLIVSDAEEDALGLPAGAQEILMLLQDRDAGAASALTYAPAAMDLHAGMLRGTPFGNGVRLPALEVAGGCYRFRLVNGSHARVYRIGLESGAPLTVIGNDGGLLPAAVDVPNIWLGVGERIDFLIDFTDVEPGWRTALRSLAFDVPGTSGKFPQGIELDLLEITRVDGAVPAMPALPPALSAVAPLGAAAGDRTFEFRSSPGEEMHRINGLAFAMDRVDAMVPFGETERWVFVNDSTLPHPVHLHGTQFQIVSRTGGRGGVLPYEAGWKDTALVMPEETVEALVRFDAYRGLFLLHCHNLQHEDMGMMMNIEVV
ncbi:MAG TPA: multicopper oxidase domain-containing protein [Gemmatimonadales bacterium]